MAYRREYIAEFYRRHVDLSRWTEANSHQFKTQCPSHDDNNPSLSINLDTGAYHCFSPACDLHPGGGMAQFLSVVGKMPYDEAKQRIDQEYAERFPEEPVKKSRGRNPKTVFPHTQSQVDDCVAALFNNPEKLEFLKTQCLWTELTIKEFEIGWHEPEDAYWIPIKINDAMVNIRKYRPNHHKKYSSVTDFGTTVLYPYKNLDSPLVYIMEGEKDCILANQLGLPAITATGGAGAFPATWKQYFANKEVVICYDIDQAGRQGALKVMSSLAHNTRSLKNIELPITEPKNGDFTDYIKAGHTVQDFLDLVAQSKPVNAPSAAVVEIPDEVIETELDKIDKNAMFYRRVAMNVRVIGGEVSPFIIPRRADVTCNRDNIPKYCTICRVGDKGNQDSVIINEVTPRLLDLIECAHAERQNVIRDIFHIPPCKQFQLKERDHQSVYRVSVIPSVDEIRQDEETQNQCYVERELYYLGERLEINNDYRIEALAIPSPKDQSFVLLGYKVEPADSSIEEFKMTPELKKELEIFQCTLETK